MFHGKTRSVSGLFCLCKIQVPSWTVGKWENLDYMLKKTPENKPLFVY